MLQRRDEEDDEKDELKPLSKEKALASIRQFKEDLHLTGIHTNKERIQSILKESGLLSDEVTKMRREEDT